MGAIDRPKKRSGPHAEWLRRDFGEDGMFSLLQRIHQAWVSTVAMRISPPEAYPNFTSNIAWNFFVLRKK